MGFGQDVSVLVRRRERDKAPQSETGKRERASLRPRAGNPETPRLLGSTRGTP